jgi:hypothetical protein
MQTAEELNADLLTMVVREIRTMWTRYNQLFFQEAMRTPMFEVVNATSFYGRWLGMERTIQLSEALVFHHPWGAVEEVLKHEMAHQFVSETMGILDESAHGPVFRKVCSEMGIDPAASGLPVVSGDANDHDTRRVIERVARLLALAESQNEHEAQAAMNAAQKLMLKHNLHQAKVSSGQEQQYSFVRLGVPTGRVLESQRILSSIIINYFFVDGIWVSAFDVEKKRRGSVLEIMGTPTNLEFASYVFSFLNHAAEQLWKEFKKSHGIKSNRDRRSFLSGVMEGFGQKLKMQEGVCKQEGLVWMGDPLLESYFRKRHPRVHVIQVKANQETAARGHGVHAGRDLVLHKPLSNNSSGKVKLLGA